jgi:hypothetical protein
MRKKRPANSAPVRPKKRRQAKRTKAMVVMLKRADGILELKSVSPKRKYEAAKR